MTEKLRIDTPPHIVPCPMCAHLLLPEQWKDGQGGTGEGCAWTGPRFHPRASAEVLGRGELMAVWLWAKVLNIGCSGLAGQAQRRVRT